MQRAREELEPEHSDHSDLFPHRRGMDAWYDWLRTEVKQWNN